MNNKILKFSLIFFTAVLLIACGKGAKDKKADISELKVKLEKLKKEKNSIEEDIRKIEDQLVKADPKSSTVQKLVSVDTVRVQDFTHYVDLQGKISAEGISYVSPNGGGGLLRAIYVKPGQKVSKGQIVAKLDDAMARQGVVLAQQSVGQIKARLAQAQTVYERYQNLWKQNIGAEIQVINAKADVDALAAQLRAAQSQVALAQEQVNMSNVHAGSSGTVEQVNVRVGEFFSGTGPDRSPQILIVNNSNIKVQVPVPENYVSRVKKGFPVKILVPETGRAPYESSIRMVGESIDPVTRSFMAEAKLPSDPLLKPNQTVTMKILDYESKGTLAVPINMVQSDEKNKYVYVMERSGDKMVARKKIVNVGEAYNGLIEIKTGLSGGDLIITEGYQTVYDGQAITVTK